MRRQLSRLRGAAGGSTRLAVLGTAFVVLSSAVALASPRHDEIPAALAEPVGLVPAPPHLGTLPPTTATVAAAPPAMISGDAPDPDRASVSAEMRRAPTTSAGRLATAEPTTTPTTRPSATIASAPVAAAAIAPAPAAALHCVVRLHGKGGSGSGARNRDGFVELAPTGNASGWGGRQWLYFPEAGYQAGRAAVHNAIDEAGCGRVIVDGFSNGAAFAAKLYCRGESFDGRLVGVIVDDPVTDHAVEGCAPAAGVRVTLYWTGALEGQAQAGWNCAAADWTCEGGSTIGIGAYAAALGTTAKRSLMSSHTPYTDPPEITQF